MHLAAVIKVEQSSGIWGRRGNRTSSQPQGGQHIGLISGFR